MFIREVVKKAKGQEYIQHKLIESYRTDAGPRQRLILNLGILDLSRDKWKILADSIESKLHNTPILFDLERDSEIEGLATHYSKVIINNRLLASDIKIINPKSEYETIDINSVKTSDSKQIGLEHLCLSQLNEYNFDKILTQLKFTENEIIYAKILVIGRASNPGSERDTVKWAKDRSGILELLNSNIKVYDNALHRVASKLWKNYSSIEESLSRKAKDLFQLQETIILYDLTNSYFEGSKRDSTICAYNKKSKEKRSDCPIITLALTIDADGFPKKSEVLKGNISEPSTLKSVIANLESNNLFAKTIVLDAGIGTEDNLQLIKDSGFKYISVSRKQSYPLEFWNESTNNEIILSDKSTKLFVKSHLDNDELFVKCYSEAKQAKESSIIKRKIESFKENLDKIQRALEKSKKGKDRNNISERIGRIKEKYKVGNLFDIELLPENGNIRSLTYSLNPSGKAKKEHVGEYVLRSNRTDLSAVEISNIHRSLTTVEDSFRSMKSDLGLRPNFHKNDKNMSAHIFITVLAYHMLAGIFKKLKNNIINFKCCRYSCMC